MDSAFEDLVSGCGKQWAWCGKRLSNVPHRVLESHHFGETGRGFKGVRGWLTSTSQLQERRNPAPSHQASYPVKCDPNHNLESAGKLLKICRSALAFPLATMTQVESQGSALNGGGDLLFWKIVCFESCHFGSASYTSQTVFSLLFQEMNWGVKRNPADFVRKIRTSDYLIPLLCHWNLVLRLQLGGRNSS